MRLLIKLEVVANRLQISCLLWSAKGKKHNQTAFFKRHKTNKPRQENAFSCRDVWRISVWKARSAELRAGVQVHHALTDRRKAHNSTENSTRVCGMFGLTERKAPLLKELCERQCSTCSGHESQCHKRIWKIGFEWEFRKLQTFARGFLI